MKRKKTYFFVIVVIVTIIVNMNIVLDEMIELDLNSKNVEALANEESSADVDCSKEGGECVVKLPKNSQFIITGIQKP